MSKRTALFLLTTSLSIGHAADAPAEDISPAFRGPLSGIPSVTDFLGSPDYFSTRGGMGSDEKWIRDQDNADAAREAAVIDPALSPFPLLLKELCCEEINRAHNEVSRKSDEILESIKQSPDQAATIRSLANSIMVEDDYVKLYGAVKVLLSVTNNYGLDDDIAEAIKVAARERLEAYVEDKTRGAAAAVAGNQDPEALGLLKLEAYLDSKRSVLLRELATHILQGTYPEY